MEKSHPDDKPQIKVVVLGAGVIGLTTAMLLSRNPRYSITIIAKHMPGDLDIEYASPWAGANYLPFLASGWSSSEGNPAAEYERETWAPLADLAQNHPESGIHFQDTMLYIRTKDISTPTGWWHELLHPTTWYSATLPSFKHTTPSTTTTPLPTGIASTISFTSVCINTALYLPYMASQCLLQKCTLARGIVTHITQAASLHSSGTRADIVINCTGLGSRFLGGVEDEKVVPARGQVVVVRNDPGVMIADSGHEEGSGDAADEMTYMMHRAAGGGCVLGGCYQKGSWEKEIDYEMAQRIMKRAVRLCPTLVEGGKGFAEVGKKVGDPMPDGEGSELDGEKSKNDEMDLDAAIKKLSIIRHGVGLRPLRLPGPRVEREFFPAEEEQKGEIVVSGPEAGEAVVGGRVSNAVVNGSAGDADTVVGEEPSSGSSKGLWVVHQYGHGGAGYQSSYGSVKAALKLVDEVVGELGLLR